jgi:hypothetical protein
MKESMWSVDQHGGQRFQGSTDPGHSSSSKTALDTQPLRRHCGGASAPIRTPSEDAELFTLEDTAYVREPSSHGHLQAG